MSNYQDTGEAYRLAYGPNPVYVRTLMYHGMDIDAAKVMVALGHTPTQDELIAWFDSDDWARPAGSPELRILKPPPQ